MYQKTCPYCWEVSFSSYKDGLWYCPYCKKDITKLVVIHSPNILVDKKKESSR